MKKLYIYEGIDVCAPGSGSYHEDGGLVVITSGDPNDAVPAGTGNVFNTQLPDGTFEKKVGLPEPDRVIVVPDDTEDAVIVFPDAGCC